LVEAEEIAKNAERRAVLASSYGYEESGTKPFVFAEGNAIIPVHGMLINRFSGSYGFVTGYNFIRKQALAANADPDVKTIIYDVNSNGGTVAGCEETADLIYGLNASQGGKPSVAVVDANCYSAAYMLASQTDHIAITPSGGAGSVGVVMMHVDVSKALEDFGVKVTFIHAGDHKVDGNMFEPLSDEVRADLQAEVDAAYDTFVAKVARGRSVSDEAVRDTEARAYGAQDALALGLVDAISNPSEAVASYTAAVATEDNQPESEENMAPKPAAAAVDPEVTSTTADASVAVAKAARTEERERVKGIQTHAEATGRETLAAHLAMNTDMDVETAGGILAASPKTSAPVAEQKTEENHFKTAMNNSKQPNLGMSAVEGDDENVSDEEKDRRRAKAILVLQHGNKRQEQAAR
jgi:signal peptide peptidase SppA